MAYKLGISYHYGAVPRQIGGWQGVVAGGRGGAGVVRSRPAQRLGGLDG